MTAEIIVGNYVNSIKIEVSVILINNVLYISPYDATQVNLQIAKIYILSILKFTI